MSGSPVRSRRFVSARAGTYPAAVPPRTAAAPRVPPIDEISLPPLEFGAPLDEPDLGALSAAPASPAFALTGPQPREDDRTSGSDDGGFGGYEDPGAEMATWAQNSKRRILIGAVIGGSLGAVAGMVLLAMAQGSLGTLANPVDLWTSIDDGRLSLTAALIAVAFAFIGVAVALRRRPERLS